MDDVPQDGCPVLVPTPIVPTCRQCGWASAHEDHRALIVLDGDGVCAWCAGDVAAGRQITVPLRIIDWPVLAAELAEVAL